MWLLWCGLFLESRARMLEVRVSVLTTSMLGTIGRLGKRFRKKGLPTAMPPTVIRCALVLNLIMWLTSRKGQWRGSTLMTWPMLSGRAILVMVARLATACFRGRAGCRCGV